MSSHIDGHEQLSKVSERIKQNKEVLNRLNYFYQSTRPNQTKQKMIQLQRETELNSKSESIHVEQKTKHQSLDTFYPNKQVKLYELERKIPIKEDLGFLGRLFKYFLLGFVLVFLIDFYYEMQNEIQHKTNEIAKCYQDYTENNCMAPLDALVDECHRLQFCASRDPKSITKMSVVFIKTVVGLIGVVAENLQITGIVLVIALVVIYLNRPTMYHEEKVRKYQ